MNHAVPLDNPHRASRVRGSPGFSAARLRDALERAGMKPAALAREAAAPRSDISKYLAGSASPQPPRLAALAAALGVPAAALLEFPPGGPGLAHLRAVAGLTQAQLATLAGIGLKRYEAGELGQRPLSGEDITRTAAAVGVAARQIHDAHQRDIVRARERGLAKSVSDTLHWNSSTKPGPATAEQPDPGQAKNS